ncbi:hypothetical protein [Ekhidna sp.]
MKQVIIGLLVLSSSMCFGQENNENSSFLSRNQPVNLFSNLNKTQLQSTNFQLKLPSERELSELAYQSDFINFMSNDIRLFNYPSGDLSELNDVVFGNYMNSSLNLGKGSLNTIYVFDQTGRLVNSSTSFSFGKK